MILRDQPVANIGLPINQSVYFTLLSAFRVWAIKIPFNQTTAYMLFLCCFVPQSKQKWTRVHHLLSQAQPATSLYFDQTSVKNTPTLLSLNNQNPLLSRLHPRLPSNHPLLSLFTLLYSPPGLQTALLIIHLIVAVIDRENAVKKRKADRWWSYLP